MRPRDCRAGRSNGVLIFLRRIDAAKRIRGQRKARPPTHPTGAHSSVTPAGVAVVSELVFRAELDVDWIHSWIGLDWITMTPFFN